MGLDYYHPCVHAAGDFLSLSFYRLSVRGVETRLQNEAHLHVVQLWATKMGRFVAQLQQTVQLFSTSTYEIYIFSIVQLIGISNINR